MAERVSFIPGLISGSLSGSLSGWLGSEYRGSSSGATWETVPASSFSPISGSIDGIEVGTAEGSGVGSAYGSTVGLEAGDLLLLSDFLIPELVSASDGVYGTVVP